MRAPNIDNLSLKQLLELEQKVAVALAKRKQEEKAELRKKMKKLAADAGFDISEVVGGRSGGGKRGPVAPKYQHPQDASLTWTGRGRQPRWLVAELKAGKKLESFLIK
jgi:DNA-binding protein H-NS